MKKNEELIGKKINDLIVLRLNGQDKYFQYLVDAKCVCGKITTIPLSRIKSGHTKSCGCLNSRGMSKHNMSKTRFYNSWRGMSKRVNLISRKDYKRYGGRGITVCEEWSCFDKFKEDMYESYLKHIKEYGKKNTSLDRIDNNGDYNKNNCKWSTYKEQANNRSNNNMLELYGEKRSASSWAKKLGISQTTISDRINRGWSLKKALTTRAIKNSDRHLYEYAKNRLNKKYDNSNLDN